MMNKYISKNMRNKIFKSIPMFKSILFLFLGLLFSTTVKSQCQIIDSVIITNISCYGEVDGAIDIVLLNPAGLYSYAWNTVDLSQDIDDLPPNVYTVTISDLVDPTCSLDTFFTITQPQDPLSTATTLYTDVDCFGDSSGVAFAENAIGGVFPYSYAWDNGQITQLAVNLWEATHVVTVTDANGCTVQSSIDIENSNDPITGDANILNQVSCFGACDANVEFSSLGGILPHTYDWNGSQIYVGSGPDTVSNLCIGGGGFTIIDAIGCDIDIDFTITEPDELFTNAIGNGAPIPGQLPTQPVQCFGFNDGTAYAFAAQGTLDYTFVWDSINGPTGPHIDSLAPGIHTVYVTDANGCTASDTVLITEPTKLVVEIDSSLTTYAYCLNTNSGELCAVASGGTPNYVYAWNDVLLQTTACAYNLQPDQYTITVMDDRNCIAQASFDLDSVTNSFTSDSVIIIENLVSCFGLYDGSLTATNVVGGVTPYIYNWNGPNSYTGTGSNISSLYFGSYNLAITDANGCPMTIGTYLNQPDQLEYDIYNTVDETCLGADNGQIWLHVNGGTSPYYYDASQSNSFPISDTVLINNDSIISNLASGAYSIYITDNNECEGAITFGGGTSAFQAEITNLLIVPTPTVDVTNNTTSCYNIHDGAAEVDSTFLVVNPLLTYTWEENISPGVPAGIDISNGADTIFGSFSAGTYWLVAHYADSASFGIPYSGCNNEISFIIAAAPDEVQVVGVSIDVSCYNGNNGQIVLDISDGWGAPYELVWDTTSAYPGGLTTSTNGNYVLEDLMVGAYAVSISDINGCISIGNYDVIEPSPLISNITPIHVSCNGFSDGQATVNVVGGSAPIISYTWSDNQTTNPATDLLAGEYTVTVQDSEGCTYTDLIEILQPVAPVALVEVDSLYHGDSDVSCHGKFDASAFAFGSGILFEWFDSDGISVALGQNSGTLLGEGYYSVESEDVNGCFGYAEIYISEPLVLSVDVEEKIYGGGYQISCNGFNDGEAEVDISGGTPHASSDENDSYYDITWEDEDGYYWSGNIIADSLYPGHYYTVTVTDANGCNDEATTILYTQPKPFEQNVSTLNYPGPLHGPVNISFIDSTESDEPYSFDWYWNFSVGDSNPDYLFDGVSQSDNQIFDNDFDVYSYDIDEDGEDELDEFLNSYSVLAALENDSTGCVDTFRVAIEVQGLLPELPNVFTPNDDGENDSFSFSEFEMESVDVQFFNRWGQLVKTWTGLDKSWDGTGIDGKDLSQGVYFYTFQGKGVDGHYYDKKGSVTLIR